MQNKSNPNDLTILEQLPPKVDLRLLIDRLAHYKQPRKKVFDLAKKGYLELVVSGHYLNLKSHDFQKTYVESIANALYFPSYISAEWALQYYGLLSDRAHTITSVTTRRTKNIKTSLGNFAFEHLHKHHYPFGYISDSENGFLIARPEKALLDYLKLRDHNMPGSSSEEIEDFLSENLRVNLSSLLQQTTADNLRELLPHYHRNSVEARVLKWLLESKERVDG
jgi:hypothetical protein